ncbi:uncharacterized protein BDZ99DRAFT_483808 [Mytilinidion resinicola]|uniref:Uncharacterized protein n=1 Tax=Mytilinidion resinicola TaxID=574789 RepID=A0A6A6XZA9_9PEZI|nr:uncharacterized protein BDZ99DRAFT_483808 [Mytilinidion resinicola]KAF2801315.1 hypothetical protein BDZ99DRAFT_483808 [Mytilinidion resinicola]
MAAGKIAGIVATFTSNVQDAPQLAHAVLCDINDFQTALDALHHFLLHKSDLEASQSQSQLNFQVEKLLSNNEELCKRLRNLEDTFDARNTLTRRLEDASIYEDNEEADSQTITTRRPMTERLGGPVMQTDIIRFAFESDLETSRVYRNAQSSHCDASFASSVARTNAWSIFSGLSLADVSVISVIALPVYSVDIENRQWYTFGDVDKVSDSLAPVAVTMPLEKLLQAAATSDKEKSEVDLDQRPLEERKNTVSHESVLIHENDLYPCSSCGDVCITQCGESPRKNPSNLN